MHVYPTPTQNGPKTGYVKLREVFAAGWLSEYVPIYKDCNDFYRRRGSGKDTSYWARVKDGAIFPLYKDAQWVQVLFWDSGDNGGRRIAWLTRSKYDEITKKPITVNPPVIQDTTSLEVITGQYFSKALSATNNPTSWSISTASLPSGLKFNTSTGVIYGTPTRTEEGDLDQHYKGKSYSLYATATNSGGTSDPKEIKITVWQTPQITTNSTLPNAYLTTPYSTQLYSNGSKYGMSWKLIAGSLPPGLSLDKESQKTTLVGRRTATISGTPTQAGTYTFTIKVAAGYENLGFSTPVTGMTTTKTFTIKVTQPVPVIKAQPTFQTITGQSFYQALSATNIPTSWKISSGSLPPGLNFNTSTGVISGTPTRTAEGDLDECYTGRHYSLYVTATNSGGSSIPQEIKIDVWQTPQITTGSTLSSGVINTSYNVSLTANGSKMGMSWRLKSGTLPPGLKLDENCQKSSLTGSRIATISGKPTKVGTYTFTMEVAAGSENVMSKPLQIKTASKTFTIKVTQPVLTPSFPTTGVINNAYSGNATVSGGKASYTWTKSGSIPTGLTYKASGAKVTLTGKPTKAGTYTFTLTAKDASGNPVSKGFTVKITTTTVSGTLPNGVIKAAYTGTLTASGGTAPYTWSISKGTLPTGLTLNKSTGKITGTPTKAGSYSFTVSATDKNKVVGTKAFTVKITTTTVSGTLPNGVVKAAYTGTLTASGGTAPYTWSISKGTLPTGLTLNKSTGKITGTPTKAGSYSFTVSATDKNKVVGTKAFTVKITAPAISGSFPNGIINTAYSGSATVSGGKAPYTWTKSGKIPTGLTYKASGAKVTLTGKPTKAGNYTFTLTAKDASGNSVSKGFTVKVSQLVVTKANVDGNELKDNVVNSLYLSVADVAISTPKNTNTIKKLSVTTTPLYVASEDILWQGEGRDEDLIEIKADNPVTFVIGTWLDDNGRESEVSDVKVYINDSFAEDIVISDENVFIIPAELVQDDFRVFVKAQSKNLEIHSIELYLSVIR